MTALLKVKCMEQSACCKFTQALTPSVFWVGQFFIGHVGVAPYYTLKVIFSALFGFGNSLKYPKPTILPPKSQDYRQVPPCQVCTVLGMEPRTLCVLDKHGATQLQPQSQVTTSILGFGVFLFVCLFSFFNIFFFHGKGTKSWM